MEDRYPNDVAVQVPHVLLPKKRRYEKHVFNNMQIYRINLQNGRFSNRYY